MTRKLFIAFLTTLISLCPSLYAQQADSSFWRVNGPVYTMDQLGDTLFVGGSFSHTGPSRFNLCRIDTITGEPDLLFPQTEGSSTIISDGHGGYIYQGNGASTHFYYTFLGRVDSAGDVMPNWPPSWPGTSILSPLFPALVHNDQVYFSDVVGLVGESVPPGFSCDTSGSVNWNMPTIDGIILWSAPDGAGGVFIGGSFSTVDGQPRSGLAHLDATGALTPFHPLVDGYITDAIRVGSFVYFSGSFTEVNGAPCTGLAKVYLATGTTVPGWSFHISGLLAGINSIDTAAGILYMGGQFNQMNLQPRSDLAAIDLATDQLTPWSPMPNNAVKVLRTNAGIIYVGGAFTTLGGTRNHVAALNAAGATLPWNPNCNGNVIGISFGNNAVYIWGEFITVSTSTRRYAAQVDPTTGLVTTWNMNLPAMGVTAWDRVSEICEMGSKVFVTGRFITVNSQDVRHIATLTTTGTLLASNITVSSFVTTMSQLNATTLFMAGDFIAVNPVARLGYAKADLTTGLLNTLWAPGVTGNGNPGYMFAHDSVIILAGTFDEINNVTRNYICAVDTVTGALTSFYPQVNGSIYSAWQDDTILYINGSFNSVNSISRNGIAGINLITGAVTPFNPLFNSAVNDVVFTPRHIIVSGNFTTVDSLPQPYLAAFDKVTGAFDTAWRPTVNGSVYEMIFDGTLIYAEGTFTMVNGEVRKGFMSMNDSTARLGTLNVDFAPGGPNKFGFQGNYLVAAGSFGAVCYEKCDNIAAFSYSSGVQIPLAAGTDGPVHSLKVAGPRLYAGGNFTQAGASPIENMAAFDRVSGNILQVFAPQPDSTVETILVDGNNLYIGGAFQNLAASSRPYLAQLDTNGTLQPFTANTDGTVFTLDKQGARIFVGGDFTTCGSQQRNYLAAVDTNGVATAWNPDPDNIVYDVLAAGTLIYAAGDFVFVNGQPRPKVVAINGTTAVPTPWLIPFNNNNVNYDVLPDSNDVYVAGDFPTMFGANLSLVTVRDRYSGSAADWGDGIGLTGNYIKTIMLTPRGLAIGGDFQGMTDHKAVGFLMIENNRQSIVTGNVYMDMNVDTVYNTGDFPMSNIWITDGTGNEGQLTNLSGNWSAYLDTGSYTYSPILQHPYMVNFPVNYQFSFSANNQIDTGGMFALQFLANVADLKTHIISYGPVRQGSNYMYTVYWDNVGTTTLNPLLVIHMDNALLIDSVVPAPDFSGGDSLGWNMTSIAPGMGGLIHVYVSVPIATVTGDTMDCSVYFSPIAGDTVPWNNTDSLDRIVTGSYDPNIKEVTPADSVVDMGTAFLSYQVQFQNTGTDTALIVVIRDTLDTNVDPSTIMILGATHQYNASIAGNVLTMTFNNIMLPDSNTNEMASHGCFRYRIAVDSGIAPGTIIENSAAIYFDYNTPVITNTTATLFDTLFWQSILDDEGKSLSFLLYPNPSDETFNLLIPSEGNNDIATITIIDVSGRTVYAATSKQCVTTIDISFLQGGCYFVNVEAGDGRRGTQKLLVR